MSEKIKLHPMSTPPRIKKLHPKYTFYVISRENHLIACTATETDVGVLYGIKERVNPVFSFGDISKITNAKGWIYSEELADLLNTLQIKDNTAP